jgi:type III secretory pathway component EscR
MRAIHLTFLMFLTLTACSQPKVDEYNSIIDRVTKIEINFKNSERLIELDKNQVEVFKSILKRNIEPEIQRKFIANIQIDLFENESRIGFLMVTENETKPFVNFGSDGLNFGFQLTYGISQYLNEKK